MKSLFRSNRLFFLLIVASLAMCMYACGNGGSEEAEKEIEENPIPSQPAPASDAEEETPALRRKLEEATETREEEEAADDQSAPVSEAAEVPKPPRATTFRNALLIYDIPPLMQQGQSTRVEALISEVQKSIEKYRELKRLSSESRIEEIKIGKVMTLRLSDDSPQDRPAFEIKPISDEEQLIDTNFSDAWEWEWDVIPLRSGQHHLNLKAVVTVVDEKFGERKVNIPVFSRQIKVKINRMYVLSGFVRNYWEFLASAIFIPLVIWGYSLYMKKRRAKATT